METQISIKNFINLKKELSKRSNLQTIDTTSQSNGYPSNTNFGIVGFSNFEAAENFAKKHATDKIHQSGSHCKAQDTHNYIIGVEFLN